MKFNKPLAICILIISLILPVLIFVFQDFFKSASSLGLLGIFIINIVSSLSFIPAPAFVSVIAGGAIYNPFLVAIISAFGASIGDMVFFVIGHSGRRLTIERLRKKLLFQVIENYFKKYGGYVLFFAALLPNPIFDSFGLFAGVFAFSPIRFFLIITLGRFVRYLLLAGIGSYF